MGKFKPVYTASQLRAFAWLPSDGAWHKTDGKIAPAVDSLKLYWPMFIDSEYGPFGPRRGYEQRARLTAAGIAEKNQIPTEFLP